MFSAAEDLCRARGLTLIEVGVFEAKEFGDAFKLCRRARECPCRFSHLYSASSVLCTHPST
jgi:hypothetical protein